MYSKKIDKTMETIDKSQPWPNNITLISLMEVPLTLYKARIHKEEKIREGRYLIQQECRCPSLSNSPDKDMCRTLRHL
jgi:hypothetical protein